MQEKITVHSLDNEIKSYQNNLDNKLRLLDKIGKMKKKFTKVYELGLLKEYLMARNYTIEEAQFIEEAMKRELKK